MRTGQEYLDSLDDGRDVIINGKPVGAIARHPAFRGAARSVAGLYDYAAAHPDETTFENPDTGERALSCYLIPRSPEDLVARRRMIRAWADTTYGLMGRSPDHVASFLAGFASNPSVFDSPHGQFSKNVTRFYQKARDEHLYLAYTIIQPQIDRSRSAHEQEEQFLAAGVYQERDDGIVIRGAQMLGTGAALADYLLLSCIQPLKPGDEDYALSVVVPINAPGLRLYSRRSYAADQPSHYDYPLSTRFDENDALVVFRDVFVPWEHVFVYRDVERVRTQWFQTPAHILGNNQAQIRLASKVRFLAGLAHKIATTNGVDKLPPVQSQLGEVGSWASIIEGMELASEQAAQTTAYGVVHPHPKYLYGVMGLQAEIYPRLVHLLRELAGGGLIELPSSVHELQNPETASDIARYVRSPSAPAEERVKLFKMAWDLVGSEFGGRHLQYEMFYAGAPFVARGYAYRNFGFSDAMRWVDQALASYGSDDPLEDDGPER